MFASLVICESSELSLSLTVMLCVLISRVPVCLSVVEVKNFKIDRGFLRSYFLHPKPVNSGTTEGPEKFDPSSGVESHVHSGQTHDAYTLPAIILQRKKLHFNRKT